MEENPWLREPLGDYVADYEKRKEILSGKKGHARALDDWMRFQNLMEGVEANSEFKMGLSMSQYNSYRILSEWWKGSIQECFLSEAAKEAIIHAADPEYEVSRNFDVDRDFARLNESRYHKEMFMLFQLEFVQEMRMLQTTELRTFFGFVQAQREKCAGYAALQRVARSFIEHDIDTAELESTEAETVTHNVTHGPELLNLLVHTIPACIESCPWLSIRQSEDGLPFYLWDVSEKKTVLTADLGVRSNYICISHTWGRFKYTDDQHPPVNIPGVSGWKVPQNTKFDVQALPDQLSSAFRTGFIWFDLLCIPQDRSERALQEIARQAAIFGNATSVIAWLNDTLSWDGLRTVVKWLSLFYLHTSVAVENGRYNILDVPIDSEGFMDDAIELYLWDAEDFPEKTVGGIEQDAISSPLPWFTSLWTLQEACLRPDLILCNRNWEPLIAGPQTLIPLDHVVALDNFIARGTFRKGVPREDVSIELGHYRKALPIELQSSLPPDINQNITFQRIQENSGSLTSENEGKPDMLPGCSDLSDLLTETRMTDLNWVCPAALFTFGQLRQCTERRYEAIMSVIGATTWYKSYLTQHGSAPPDENLVLGYYPAAFLNEALTKLGPTFFTAIPADLGYTTEAVSLLNDTWTLKPNPQPIGSMLPFTNSTTYLVPPQKYAFGAHNHPSVLNWRILDTAGVRITKAAILTPQQLEENPSGEPDMLIAPLPDSNHQISDESEIEMVDGHLPTWLRTFSNPETCPNYAVSLYQQIYLNKEIPGPQVGLLLKQVRTAGSGSGPESGQQTVLVKVGQFFTHCVAVWEVPSVDVDWIIL